MLENTKQTSSRIGILASKTLQSSSSQVANKLAADYGSNGIGVLMAHGQTAVLI